MTKCEAWTAARLSRHYPSLDNRGHQCSRNASVSPDAYGRSYCKQHAATHGIYSERTPRVEL